MVGALFGVILVLGGLYALTHNAPIWHQAQHLLAQLVAALGPREWQRVEYVAAIGALAIGAGLILMRLFGGRGGSEP